MGTLLFISSSFYYFTLLLSLYVLTKHFLIHKLHKLPPTPFPSLPIIGHVYLFKQPLHRTFCKLSYKLGPVVYLQLGSRPVIVVSSPSLAEECFTKNDIVFANRPRLLVGKYIGYNYTALTQASYGDHWRGLRRIVSSDLLSTNRLQMMSEIRLNEVKSMIRLLFRDQNRVVDMKAELFGLSLNIAMMMIAGKRYYGENISDVEGARRYKEILEETVVVNSQANIGDHLPWIGPKKKLVEWLIEFARKRDDFMQCLIDEHRRNMDNSPGQGQKTTLIQVLLKKQEKEADYYTDDIIKGLMLVIVAVGTDTTGNTMEWALSLLVNHPRVLEKAQTEIDKCVGHGRLIDETDLPNLPYLRAIINETMRMYPVAPLLLPHESLEECAVGGYRVPRGAMLFVNVWAIQNDPSVWTDPRKFNPERFEEERLDGTKDGFKLLPFGYGRRSCPGEGLAFRVMGLTLGSLIQCFDWETIGHQTVDMAEVGGITVSKRQPLQLKCRPRPQMLKALSRI